MSEKNLKKSGKTSARGLRGFHCPHCRTSQEFRALHIKSAQDVLMVLLLRYPMRCIRCLKSFYGPRRLLSYIRPAETLKRASL